MDDLGRVQFESARLLPAVPTEVSVRRIGLAVVLGLTMSAFTAEAQQAGKIYRIGVLSSASSIPDETVAQGRRAFSERLRDLGWVVGENLTYESRNADQRPNANSIPPS